MSNFNINDFTAKLQQLQNQAAQLNQMQAQPAQSPTPTSTTYPKVIRSDTVEDILANPQWRQELEAEFSSSDLGEKAKNFKEGLFMQFCEQATGKPSAMLEGLRKEAKAKEKPVASGKKSKPDTPTESKEE